MAIEVRIPEDLWSFVGMELKSRRYITQEVLVSAIVEEPKLKWLLLDCEEWQTYRSFSDLRDLNPIEHSEETQQELSETENTHAIFVKETLKEFPETEKIFKELGFKESDYVVLMSADRTGEVFRKADTTLRSFGKVFYHRVDGLRLAMLIHELIHIYEFKLGKPIIGNDLQTESILQNDLFLHYLKSHLTNPKDFKLSYL